MQDSGDARDGAGDFRSRFWLGAGAAIAGALLLAVVVLLALTLQQISKAREHVGATDAKLERVINATEPAADDAQGLLEAGAPLLESARPLLRGTSAFVDSIADNGDEVSVVLARLLQLALSVQELATVGVPTLERAALVLDEIERTGVVARAAETPSILTEMLGALQAVLETQRTTLETQQRTFHLQIRTATKLRRSLEVQRATLKHVRSLDNKTGGQLPVP